MVVARGGRYEGAHACEVRHWAAVAHGVSVLRAGLQAQCNAVWLRRCAVRCTVTLCSCASVVLQAADCSVEAPHRRQGPDAERWRTWLRAMLGACRTAALNSDWMRVLSVGAGGMAGASGPVANGGSTASVLSCAGMTPRQ